MMRAVVFLIVSIALVRALAINASFLRAGDALGAGMIYCDALSAIEYEIDVLAGTLNHLEENAPARGKHLENLALMREYWWGYAEEYLDAIDRALRENPFVDLEGFAREVDSFYDGRRFVCPMDPDRREFVPEMLESLRRGIREREAEILSGAGRTPEDDAYRRGERKAMIAEYNLLLVRGTSSGIPGLDGLNPIDPSSEIGAPLECSGGRGVGAVNFPPSAESP